MKLSLLLFSCTFLLSSYTGKDKKVFLKACQMGVSETFSSISSADFDSPNYVNLIESCGKMSGREEKVQGSLKQSGCDFAVRAVYGQLDLDIRTKLSSEQRQIVDNCISRLE